jgi:hypothetical protein
VGNACSALTPYNLSQAILHEKYQSLTHLYNSELIGFLVAGREEQPRGLCSIPAQARIQLGNIKFDDEVEVMVAYSSQGESLTELGQLCEYYKYYLPVSPIMHRDFFRLMRAHAEKRKEMVYRKLQKILNLTQLVHSHKSERPEVSYTQAQP